LSGVGLVGVLVLPIALNVYTPEWNAFLKQLPLIKTTASPCRWFMIYIPILTIGSVVAVHQARHLRSADKWIGGAGILLVLLWVALENRGIYFTLLEAGYNPASAELAWERLQEGETPRLSGVAQVGPPLRPGGAPLMRNDLVFAGLSQATCYNPVFGYRLEHLPTGPLHMGPALSDNGKIFNIKNPACYVWPKENRCQPGDHFRVNQREQAEAFVSYHPWQFAISSTQRWANRITEVGLVLTLVLGLLSLLWPRVASSGLGKQ